ncbi:MAG: cytochrome c3 family protein [Candidatus Methanoperedens sp.]|nr:cytochrome c3 family protein [Candidatus Methanoperedens sp.]
MSVLGDKTGHANIRHVILTFIILSGLATAFLYYPPIPTRTAEELTHGDITFADISGNPISGAIGISGSGISGGYKENVNFIKWTKIPNGIIYFDALGIKNVSVKFRLGGDSRNANVVIENYGTELPKALNEPAPGTPVKYVQVSALNISFVEAEISIKYNASELGNIDENSLKIYHYNRTMKAWSSLKTKIDAKDELLTASVDSLSIFAVSARLPGQIDILDAGSTHVRSDIRTYDNARDLKKSGRSSSLVAQDIPPGGELEVDAITSKNVALRLKVNAATGGEVILDDYGRKNPVSVPLPGRPVKFVEIGVQGISFSSAQVSVRYKEAELNGVSENSLVIYHWNGTAWDALPTTVDAANNVLTATTTSLSPFAVSGGTGGQNKILVATDRYVVLDDWQSGNASTNYVVPNSADVTTSDFFTNKQTTIGAKALLIDSNGTPLQSKTVNFTIFRPGGTYATGTSVTDSSGVASFYKDLSGANYWGNWTVKADYSGISKNSSFIYNWWGCAWGGSCRGHGGVNPNQAGTAAPNSPYTASWEMIAGSGGNAQHESLTGAGWGQNWCTVCHQNYDGNPTTSNAINGTAKDFYSPDVHRNIRCDNASCHDPGVPFYTNHKAGNMTIGSCTSARCHPLRTDISMKSTLNGVVSNYSNSSSGGIYDDYHTPNSTVPCIICHGPMHNITKPDDTQRFIGNNNTEDSQCTTCHSGYSQHNASVNCTLCHSDDVHYIQVFGGSTYVNTNSPARGDCTKCHQNSTFMGVLSNIPKTGKYTGRNAPQVPVSVVHSDDIRNGSKWTQTRPYWTNTSQIQRCKYCHGETMHKISALGRPSLFSGGNRVNGSISSSLTWCQQCHWQGSPDYYIMVGTFNEDNRTVPPEITGNATYGNITGTSAAYINHSSYAKNDAKCKSCHGGPASSENITSFMHAVAVGTSGGVNCTNCHNTGGSADNVNFTALNLGMHAFLNSGAVSTPANASNRPCWACHGTKNGTWANESDQPVEEHNTSVYNKPRKCYDCHNDTFALFGAGNVTDHIPSGLSPYTDVNTSSYTNTYCSYCHNNSLIDAYDASMGVSGGSPVNASVSHYGANRTAGRLMSTTSNSTDCVYCHRNSSNMQKWGILPGSRANISNKNASGGGLDHTTYTSSSNCPTCHGNYAIVGGFTFHKAALGSGSSGGPGCLGCHNTSSPQNVTGMHYIDGGNFSRSTHANMNVNNASGYGINASCWACHNSTGTVVPSNTHPDRKTTPFICTDCHLANGSRAGAYNATIISNHFKNGTAIRALGNRTSDIASCIECHENVSGMLLPNNDNDTGSFAGDNISVTGGSTSAYHYGKSQLSFGKTRGSDAYCLYCHRNGTGEFNRTFMYASNSSISNHSARYNASNPSCGLVQCHNSTGETLHGRSLIMPGTVYNSSYCLNCHGLNSSSGTANYSGITTGTKNKHNNSVNCKECHMNDGKDIHPVKYLQTDGIFNTSNSTAANCILCHQTGIANFSNASGIPSMHHSDDISNGSRWNLTKTYWTNTSQQSMCNYCHGDSRHSENALGRPANWSGLNIINSSIANNSNWCSGCHYQGYTSGAMNYNNMVLTFQGENMSVPPEISNHSSFAPYSKNGYFNHTLSPDYSDSTCKECHGAFLPNGTRIDGFMHNVSTGTGICTGCHYSYSYMSTLGAAEKFVNQSMYNSSAHGSLACEDCHTKGHKNIAARKACEDCHSYQKDPINDRDRHNITGTPAQNVVNNTICTSCHDTGLYNNATAQYGYGKTYDCNYCHTYPDKTYS